MRLGGPIFTQYDDPGRWAAQVRAAGYQAAYCPVGLEADTDEIKAYAQAAKKADLVIAEVGAWSSPLSPDEATRQAAIEKCQRSLALADEIGARCCVNVSGSRGPRWAGPYETNLTEETFEMIVFSVRQIIDTVQPKRAFYTLEMMPFLYPDSPESYLRLLQAIGRRACAVHLDPVNIINSPQRYYQNAALLKECFSILGPYIKSCHAKDIILHDKLTVHMDEARPGQGYLDYRVFLSELQKLDPDTPLMLEHLPNEAEYKLAADYIRGMAHEAGISL